MTPSLYSGSKRFCMQRSSSAFPSYGESESRSVMSDSWWLHGLYSPWNSPGQNTGVDSLSLLQGIFPTQGSNTGLPNCRWIIYQLNLKGSPRILEWVVYPEDLLNPGIKPGCPALQVGSLSTELSEKPLVMVRENIHYIFWCNKTRGRH